MRLRTLDFRPTLFGCKEVRLFVPRSAGGPLSQEAFTKLLGDPAASLAVHAGLQALLLPASAATIAAAQPVRQELAMPY